MKATDRGKETMDSVESLLSQILFELKRMNMKLDKMTGRGQHHSITAVCNKLDDIEDKLSSIDLNTMSLNC